ncbi:Crp/Fnr family transcriptional regulator [Sporolactobacillus kofuensis]|uniref:Crp/Fnr family transcriptional regulator n=1 Tax=Sporolactobacillus kofuensis TaxID=269672 RepID=A0ABW1WB32_9BACL|nr:Crp/Fnr family transcriptional regulator [Sporolactobacillus kofuensis]MCO7174972.1 Crp/Fnr family transcriptional regulator [Sporolactobacillus kofuensis]
MIEESKDNQIINYLEKFHLESVFKEPLRDFLSICTFKEGQVICSQGTHAHYLSVLVTGKIKIFTNSREGKTLILSFMTPLEMIGDIEYVMEKPYLNTVQAISPVTMIRVSYDSLKQYGWNDPDLQRFLLKIITNKFYIKSNFMSFNLMHSVEVRLASYLLSVGFDETGQQQTESNHELMITDIANLIGTSYRHLNRVIVRFCADGLVERNKGYLKAINKDGLSKIAGGNIYES